MNVCAVRARADARRTVSRGTDAPVKGRTNRVRARDSDTLFKASRDSDTLFKASRDSDTLFKAYGHPVIEPVAPRGTSAGNGSLSPKKDRSVLRAGKSFSSAFVRLAST